MASRRNGTAPRRALPRRPAGRGSGLANVSERRGAGQARL